MAVRIPADAIIADEKLTQHLLVRRARDDKSGFLRSAGFVLENWHLLRQAIRALADSTDAVEDGGNEYGTFFRVDGILAGPEAEIVVTLIWMRRTVDGRIYFITLKPRSE